MENQKPKTKTANHGFASLSRERRIEISRKGGLKVSQDKEHMAAIGRKGGVASGNNKKTVDEVISK